MWNFLYEARLHAETVSTIPFDANIFEICNETSSFCSFTAISNFNEVMINLHLRKAPINCNDGRKKTNEESK